MESRESKFNKIKSSMSVVDLNNMIVRMRPVVKKAKVNIVHHLHRKIKQLKTKKGTDEETERNAKKAERLAEEIIGIKKLSIDKVSKFSLDNTISYSNLCLKPGVSAQLRGMTRLTEFPAIQKIVTKFRNDHTDWKSLSAFLLYKQTGRRFKKTKKVSDGVALNEVDSLARKKKQERIESEKALKDNDEGMQTQSGSDEDGDAKAAKKAEKETKRKNKLNKPKLNILDIFANKSGNSSSDNNSEPDSGNETSSEEFNATKPRDLLAKRLLSKSQNDEPNIESEDSESSKDSEQFIKDNSKSDASDDSESSNDSEQPKKSLMDFASDSNDECSINDDFAESLLKAAKLNNIESKSGSNNVEPKSASKITKSRIVSKNILTNQSETDSESSDSENISKSSVLKSSPANKEMVIKRLNLDNLDEDLNINTTVKLSVDDTPSILQTDAKHKKKDSFFVTGDSATEDEEEEEVQKTFVRQPDSDDDDMLRSKGREMVESVFIGKLSKKPKSRQNHSRKDRPRQVKGKEGDGMKFKNRIPGSRDNSYGRQDQWPNSNKQYKKDTSKGSRSDFKPKTNNKLADSDKQSYIHPSWEASRKRKEQQSKIAEFKGKKIKFTDSD